MSLIPKEPHVFSKEELQHLLRNADAVSLDVDSTVCVGEGLDDLATFEGYGAEVANMTNRAMSGSITLKEALKFRLDIVNPTLTTIENFLSSDQCPKLAPGVMEFVQELKNKGKVVHIISGGFDKLLYPCTDKLGIARENIYCNKMIFNDKGEYVGFDETCPTCENMGKAKVAGILKEKYGYQCLVHIGDGYTDFEACPPADGFIGFGGNVVRDKVERASGWFVRSFDELTNTLRHGDAK